MHLTSMTGGGSNEIGTEFDCNYTVRFIGRDNQLNSEYWYWQREDAEHHVNMFIDDDSNIYNRIELVEVSFALGVEKVLTVIHFD